MDIDDDPRNPDNLHPRLAHIFENLTVIRTMLIIIFCYPLYRRLKWYVQEWEAYSLLVEKESRVAVQEASVRRTQAEAEIAVILEQQRITLAHHCGNDEDFARVIVDGYQPRI